jgi:hypothetical protein
VTGSSALAAVCMAFQAVSRAALPVALVGAGLPNLQVRLMKAKPYADRLFEYRELGCSQNRRFTWRW